MTFLSRELHHCFDSYKIIFRYQLNKTTCTQRKNQVIISYEVMSTKALKTNQIIQKKLHYFVNGKVSYDYVWAQAQCTVNSDLL